MQNSSRTKRIWLGIALVNLVVVAALGLLLRSKIVFSLPFIDFKYILHAHSHYAFGGWITIALLTLLTYEVLPASKNRKKIYNLLLAGILLNAVGMLISFPLQGYAFYSILFSTLFIFATYVYSYVFIKDMLKTRNSRTVKLLSIAAIVYLVISSVGPFSLAYLLATKSGNAFLYRDSIYTYLHLQYNGFFTLAVMALLINRVEHLLNTRQLTSSNRLAHLLNFTVVPSMFLNYLWHYPNNLYRILAISGSISLALCTVYFLYTAWLSKNVFKREVKAAKILGTIALAAFVLKMTMQAFTIFPVLGKLVFTNRPMIIAFLHLVLLGFISLYIIAHMLHAGYLHRSKQTITAAYVFAAAVVVNELVLFMQGTGVMFMTNSSNYNWLLWATGAWLFVGSIMLAYNYYAGQKVKIKTSLPQMLPRTTFQRKNYNKYE